MQENTCCFIGHRTINETEELRTKLINMIEQLITVENIGTFLFGSRSRFDSLCLEVVTQFKEKYFHIKRVYVRGEYPIISDEYRAYLLESYDDTYYPDKIIGSGRAAYVERNFEMIEQSRICVFYYDEKIKYSNSKSGTKIALDQAVKKGKSVMIL